MTIYAGSAHTVADIPESLYEELKFLLQGRPDAFALLEFTSPGGHHRQIDCAVVSAGGVDLIEIKHKRNPVRGTADGPWATEDDGRLNVFSNRKAGVTENPYQQAANSGGDLAWGLARVLGLRRERVRVYPMVLIPEAHPECEIAEHSNVKLALGSDALKDTLRAYNWKAVWSPDEYGELPGRLGLTPIELGNVTGRVVDGETGQPVRGVRINVPGRDEPLHSDFRGGFRFMAPLGAHLSLVLEPETSHEVTGLELSVSHRHLDLGNVALPPVVTEAARQAALAQLEVEFQQRLTSLQAVSHEQVEHLTALNQTLLDGLQREHDERRTLERRLAGAVKQAAPGDLGSQVQQRHELARVREQLEHSEHLLQELRRPEVQIGDAIRREAAEHLVVLRAARLPALPPAGSPVGLPGDAPRFRVTGRSAAPVPRA
ncbi:nuclease-related domain-containing protein, partial [Deinococcus sp. MIMF12]